MDERKAKTASDAEFAERRSGLTDGIPDVRMENRLALLDDLPGDGFADRLGQPPGCRQSQLLPGSQRVPFVSSQRNDASQFSKVGMKRDGWIFRGKEIRQALS